MEKFFTCYENTISVFGIIASFLVVGVSLYLANRQYKPKTKYFLRKSTITQGYEFITDNTNGYKDFEFLSSPYLALEIRNTGYADFIINSPPIIFLQSSSKLIDLYHLTREEVVLKYPLKISPKTSRYILLDEIRSIKSPKSLKCYVMIGGNKERVFLSKIIKKSFNKMLNKDT